MVTLQIPSEVWILPTELIKCFIVILELFFGCFLLCSEITNQKANICELVSDVSNPRYISAA